MNLQVITYLDQNYLSNMAKARIGCIKDAKQSEFWQSLFADLKKAVLADKIACPESEFHAVEAMYDRRLEKPLSDVINELYYGLKFRLREHILEYQIEDAALRFLSKIPAFKEPWMIAFTTNPYISVKHVVKFLQERKEENYSLFSWPDLHVELNRKEKAKYVQQEELIKNRALLERKQLIKEYGKVHYNWNDVLLAEKMSLAHSIFLPDLSVGNYWRFSRIWKKLASLGIELSDTDTAARFLKSDKLLETPYFDICCSINATINMYHPERKFKGSDIYDVAVLATVLPYCDIVTTDNFMKEIVVKKLNFDKKYKTRLFSANKVDRFELHNLLKKLVTN